MVAVDTELAILQINAPVTTNLAKVNLNLQVLQPTWSGLALTVLSAHAQEASHGQKVEKHRLVLFVDIK